MNLVATTFHNGLGNFVVFTSALKALADLFDAKIDLYLDDTWTDSRRVPVELLFKMLPYANDIISFQKVAFKKSKYKAVYWPSHGEKNDCWHLFERVADLRAEFKSEDDSWLQHRMHELDFYMHPIFDYGYRGPVPRQLYGLKGLHYSASSYCTGKRVMDAPATKKLKIGLCNGYFAEAQWDWSRKCWPHFDRLALMIKNFFGTRATVFLLGNNQAEQRWAKEVSLCLELQGYGVKNLVDKYNVFGTIRKVRALDVLISTDTGLMHVGDAVGTPLIAIFGSTLVSKNGPCRMTGVKLVQSLAGCAPCQDTPDFYLCKDYKCMREITPADIMGQLLVLLEEMGYVLT